jgi:hypothetical protein
MAVLLQTSSRGVSVDVLATNIAHRFPRFTGALPLLLADVTYGACCEPAC